MHALATEAAMRKTSAAVRRMLRARLVTSWLRLCGVRVVGGCLRTKVKKNCFDFGSFLLSGLRTKVPLAYEQTRLTRFGKNSALVKQETKIPLRPVATGRGGTRARVETGRSYDQSRR